MQSAHPVRQRRPRRCLRYQNHTAYRALARTAPAPRRNHPVDTLNRGGQASARQIHWNSRKCNTKRIAPLQCKTHAARTHPSPGRSAVPSAKLTVGARALPPRASSSGTHGGRGLGRNPQSFLAVGLPSCASVILLAEHFLRCSCTAVGGCLLSVHRCKGILNRFLMCWSTEWVSVLIEYEFLIGFL